MIVFDGDILRQKGNAIILIRLRLLGAVRKVRVYNTNLTIRVRDDRLISIKELGVVIITISSKVLVGNPSNETI